ncbi:conserved hypothetical protein [Vibrio coralliirubri]|uniref:DUF3299 domain-containing protein n=1 Tax=Vibrio coralliirubri TaxID=1516159 RepID=UPI00063819FB|nr:DUF3299 domain-containing protein [Vibrio coralliirubri]CDT44056.1 conserved hypothetical protein [Vibrio coralliirubri]
MKKLTTTLGLSVALFSAFSVHADTQEIEWIDLVPAQEQAMIREATQPFLAEHSWDMPEQNKLGSVRKELDGQHVKIPGFIIPLEGDDEIATEFLLVPYYGACIHVPPPPTNQIIYVNSPKDVSAQGLWDTVYLTGTLRTKDTSTDVADTGYQMIDIEIAPYQ